MRASEPGQAPRNILSIDFESWVHFYRDALRDADFARGDLSDADGGYVPEVTGALLELFERHGQRATFFVVAELYDHFPEAIERLAEAGHEIGYHTHNHVWLRSPAQLSDELRQSRRFLERFRPLGFRAPYIHLPEGSWSVLEQAGFRYSSSTYRCGGPERHGTLAEIPVSCLRLRAAADSGPLPQHLTPALLTRQIPYGSGLFVGLLGAGLSPFIRRTNRDGRPAVLFVHPWQLYQPPPIRGYRFKARVLTRNPLCLPYTRCVLASVRSLLERHRFTSFASSYFDQSA